MTPMMEQYVAVKKQHPDEVLFFRLGDFYEMFDEDAVEVSRLLNLTLTHRAQNQMCGIPYHASKVYIARLLRLGKKIAICEQVGEISPAGGLTQRKVTQIITPGTALESEYQDAGQNNFLASLCVTHGQAAFAFVDVTTSEFKATSWPASQMDQYFAKELERSQPKEFLLPLSLKENPVIKETLLQNQNICVSYYPDWHFNADTSFEKLTSQFGTANLKSFNLDKQNPEIVPAGFLIEYLEKTTNTVLTHIKNLSVYHDSDFVIIDESTQKNLEITRNLRDSSIHYSLLECVNYTLTAMGSRTLRTFLVNPLCKVDKIKSRQDHVEFFVNNNEVLDNVRAELSKILDIERLAGRIAMEKAHAKDLQALRFSLESWISACKHLKGTCLEFADLKNALFIADLIEKSIHEDPATSLTEGRLIKKGWSSELDHYHEVQANFNKILEDYLEEEKQNTGISNLKIKSNNNAGYFIEVTKGKLSSVPPHFIIRRSMMNADRYTTERLQSLEQELNNAASKILETERDLFIEIRTKLCEYIDYLMNLSHAIAYIDTISCFAHAAVLNQWTKPELDDSGDYFVEGGRHPVVEKYLPKGEFVSNDLNISSSDKDKKSFALITGPNMAGKSTYLRQNALIALLAQTGSFVPADKVRLGVIDRIFCRVGASDNLARGESTFLVEMSETARILKSATKASLVIMDEVGRGTSTEDGLSIAQAVSEHLLNSVKCRTLFATHYHELTRMNNDNLQFLCMSVKEEAGTVVFLRKVIYGSEANSYGIHVARLAGVPDSVIDRARILLEEIQSRAETAGNETDKKTEKPAAKKVKEEPVKFVTPGLFSDEEIILDEILSCDLDNITPMNAHNLISRWKKTLLTK